MKNLSNINHPEAIRNIGNLFKMKRKAKKEDQTLESLWLGLKYSIQLLFENHKRKMYAYIRYIYENEELYKSLQAGVSLPVEHINEYLINKDYTYE